MELRRYLAVLRRRASIIGIVVGITLVAVIIITLLMPPTYIATATLRIAATANGSNQQIGWDSIQYADRLANTYINLAKSPAMREAVARQLNLATPPKIDAETPANTELLHISATATDGFRAAETANALADTLIAQSRASMDDSGSSISAALQQQLSQAKTEMDQAYRAYLLSQGRESASQTALAEQTFQMKQRTYENVLDQYDQARVADALRANALTMVTRAVAPNASSTPSLPLNLALGILVGISGGLALAFVMEYLDTTLYTSDQIEEVIDQSTLARIPTICVQQKSSVFEPNTPQEDAIRRLTTNLYTATGGMPLKTLLITSADPNEGKSTVVANLAAVVGQSGQKVIVIDADLRLPTLHKIFALPNDVGLSSVLTLRVPLEEALQGSYIPTVQVLTSGPLPSNPAELLGSDRMVAILEQLTRMADLVIVDAPSLLAVADAMVVARAVDGVLFVIGRACVRREAVQAAQRQLASVKVRPVGVVVNRAEPERSHDYYKQQAG